MKANLKFAVSFCCLLGTSMYSALAQGFVNLDFEAVTGHFKTSHERSNQNQPL